MLARRNCIAAMGDDEEKPVKRERGERGGKNRASKKAWQARHPGFVAPHMPLIPALIPPPPKAATQVPRHVPPPGVTLGTSAKGVALVPSKAAPVLVAAALVLPKATPVVVAADLVPPKAAPVVVAAALVLPKATPGLLAAALAHPKATPGVVHLKNDLFSCCLCAVPLCYVQARVDVLICVCVFCSSGGLVVLVVCLRAFC